MMARSQISMPLEQQRRAQKRAGELGISFAEYVRRLVDRDLDGGLAEGDTAGLFDLGDSGGSDVAAHKDRYVGEAVEGAR
jgi:hypothetical protein